MCFVCGVLLLCPGDKGISRSLERETKSEQGKKDRDERESFTKKEELEEHS